MGFWVFMLSMNLMIPIVMIVFGNVFVHNAPKKINSVYGYRTSRSMKNKDTWDFAHHYCGGLWRIIGWALLPISAAIMLFAYAKDTDTVANFGMLVCAVQIIALIATIVPTELALKRNFDENGIRKNR